MRMLAPGAVRLLAPGAVRLLAQGAEFRDAEWFHRPGVYTRTHRLLLVSATR